MDTAATNLLGDRYGFFSDRALRRSRSPPPAGDERHRADADGSHALGDRRFPLEPAVQSRRRRFGDLNADGYTGDLPAGVMPGSGCRDLNLDAVNASRTSRGLTAVTTSIARASPTSICGCRRSFRIATVPRRVHRAAVQHLRPRELQRRRTATSAPATTPPDGRCSARARRCSRTSTRRRGRRSSRCVQF